MSNGGVNIFALPFALYRQAEQDVRSRQARPD